MKEIHKMYISEFMHRMIGTNVEDMSIENNAITIKDILDTKKLPDQVLESWAQTLRLKDKQLSEIMRLRTKYPYSYAINSFDEISVYYWLDVNMLDWFGLGL